MAVVGNGEEAAIDALFLSDITSKVVVVTNEQELNIEGALMDRLQNKPNIEIIKGQVIKILGAQWSKQ